MGAFTDAVKALAYQKAGQPAEARAALDRARATYTRHRPRSEWDRLHDTDWFHWARVEILIREADGLIPAAPAVAARGRSSPKEEAARRDRQTRAEKASIDFVLALVRLDIGQKAEAETALRRMLIEQRKTQKRVNALRYNVIPKYRETIHYIGGALEEEERNTLFQIKVLRERKPSD